MWSRLWLLHYRKDVDALKIVQKFTRMVEQRVLAIRGLINLDLLEAEGRPGRPIYNFERNR